MEVRSVFGLNSETRDQPTDGRTDGRTDKASYRVACLRLKISSLSAPAMRSESGLLLGDTDVVTDANADAEVASPCLRNHPKLCVAHADRHTDRCARN